MHSLDHRSRLKTCSSSACEMKTAGFNVWVLASSPKENFGVDFVKYLGFQQKLNGHKNSVNNLVSTLQKSSVCLESYQFEIK